MALYERIKVTERDMDVQLAFPDGQKADVPKDLSYRSRILADVTSFGQSGDITVPNGMLESWLQYFLKRGSTQQSVGPCVPCTPELSSAYHPQLPAFMKVRNPVLRYLHGCVLPMLWAPSHEHASCLEFRVH